MFEASLTVVRVGTAVAPDWNVPLAGTWFRLAGTGPEENKGFWSASSEETDVEQNAPGNGAGSEEKTE